ncbi:MAG TPA: DUF5367 family protein [Bryobacteraceae bacterium]|nr:DUF5367 family protein [Bryobacteraceae bacterium]
MNPCSGLSRLFVLGLAAWIAGTLALRLWGQAIVRPDSGARTVLLFGITFPLVAWLVRRLCRATRLRQEDWPAGAVALLLPTLILDPFSSAFFTVMFPNMAPGAAGVFGGWMLWCCAAGLVGASFGRRAA